MRKLPDPGDLAWSPPAGVDPEDLPRTLKLDHNTLVEVNPHRSFDAFLVINNVPFSVTEARDIYGLLDEYFGWYVA